MPDTGKKILSTNSCSGPEVLQDKPVGNEQGSFSNPYLTVNMVYTSIMYVEMY